MLSKKTLPAGLLDDNIEFFNDPTDQEKVYALQSGHVFPFFDFPENIIRIIKASMADHPARVDGIKALGYTTEASVMQKYVSCLSGAFDGDSDVVNGQFLLNEFWDCPLRHTCPGYGKVCNSLRLTPQEDTVLKLVANSMLDKEIADELGISFFTVKQHLRNIRQKTGLRDKPDMMRFAYIKNLI